ncbi:MAG: MoaD/ThiS family protein [Candidatus Latescibacterota bacterium]|nr:MAG: MoaD/ThiS family protein [Candidatus Latescibacterota bacterium]
MKVRFSSHLAAYTKGASEIEERAATLAELVDRLELRFPGIRFRMIDEQDRIRPHLRFFVGGEPAKDLARPIHAGEDVHILGALSGG